MPHSATDSTLATLQWSGILVYWSAHQSTAFVTIRSRTTGRTDRQIERENDVFLVGAMRVEKCRLLRANVRRPQETWQRQHQSRPQSQSQLQLQRQMPQLIYFDWFWQVVFPLDTAQERTWCSLRGASDAKTTRTATATTLARGRIMSSWINTISS